VTRRSGGLLNRCIGLLNRAQCFSELFPQARGGFPERVEDLLFPRSLHLLACQGVPTGAIRGVQANDVLASQTPNRACQDCSASGALADLASRIEGDTIDRRAAHHTQHLAYSLVREN